MTVDTQPSLTIDDIVEMKAGNALDERSLAEIFVEARTANAFLDRAIPHGVVDRALGLALFGPTSANSLPLRVVFVESQEAKNRLEPALSEGNRDKTMAAPLTAVVAADLRFFEHLKAFFADGRFVSQYLINIGYADTAKVYPRLPRFDVSDVSQYA